MAEGSDGFTGTKTEGNEDVHYRDGEVLGLLQTEHSGIGFNPFVNASHTDAERHSPAGQAGAVPPRLHGQPQA